MIMQPCGAGMSSTRFWPLASLELTSSFKSSHSLRAAEDRIAALEVEVQLQKDRVGRASGCIRSTPKSRIDLCGGASRSRWRQ
jgi:hypothetical protein